MSKTKNNLGGKVGKAIISTLQPLLVEAIDLKLQAKQAHWNVKGANFIGIHELFDDVADDLDEYADLIAERIVQLGGQPNGTSQALAQHSKIKPYPDDIRKWEDHVEAFTDRLADLGAKVRSGIDCCSDEGDQDAADILTEVSRGIDKRLWFLEAHLQG